MRNNSLIFIGPINLGQIPTAGDSMKNQLFLDRFRQVFDRVITIDTINWKRRPWVIFQLIIALMAHPKAKAIISANPGSADALIRFIRVFKFPNDFYYWVVGGFFHKSIKNKSLSVNNYTFLKRIFVQGESMVESLRESGLNNVVYVPNSKLINHYGQQKPKQDKITHFVFLSRIEEYKGCTDIFKSVDALAQSGYQGKFDVTFYGRKSEDSEYVKCFQEMVDAHNEVKYKGLLNLRDTNNYDELAQYDVMLFPTYWQGEGFPGIVIDAYISSLPIIASDWNLNRDVIEDGMTGWIIPPHNVEALTERMKYVIAHPEEVLRMSQICRERAAQYDSRKVLSEKKLKQLGLIDY